MEIEKRKLNLTMKITDSVLKLSVIVSGYAEKKSGETVGKFNQWADETREFLSGHFDKDKVDGFDRLAKPSKAVTTADEMNEASRAHADYLQELIQEIVD